MLIRNLFIFQAVLKAFDQNILLNNEVVYIVFNLSTVN